MRAVEIIIGVCVLILMMAAVLWGITQFRSEEYTEPHVVSTGVGVTTADIVLTQALFSDATYWVTITSNNTGDAAVPASYTSATRTLTVSGLLENISHYLSITYRYGQLDSYWAADLMSRAWPVLLILGSFGLLAAGTYEAWTKEAAQNKSAR